jgi:4-hydroxythreonine-4-phosphate dehydrogenase
MAPKLAFTCGDPAGVGPEIIEAWLRRPGAASSDVAVIGPQRWLQRLPGGVEKIAVGLEEFDLQPGQPSGEGALIAWAALERAAAGCASGEFAGTVTGPVSKEALAKIGWSFPGQTEFFAARWGGEPVMAFCGGRLNVVLATWHIPLRAVPDALSLPLLRRTVDAAAEFGRVFASRPLGAGPVRIAVCGLNPHAGEGGILGTEERDRLDPMLDELRVQHPGLSRCLPGDTVFGRALRGDFDVAVALYHDQGLAPLKTIDFDEAVNVTLGLPHVRTSPDHGTAFGIAGKGVASANSFGNAVEVARRLIAHRAR